MSLIISLGVVGSIASILGLLLPAQGWRLRLLHGAYGLVIAILAGLFVTSQTRLARVQNVERAAAELVEDHLSYTSAGFIQAGLSFLEVNRDLLPDTYERAQELCRKRDCWGVDDTVGDVSVGFTMKGLLQGIATTHTARK
jgi:hypothetical protein